ncbi:MAG: hypothetical protein NZ700_13215 [Gemmataceae bacterium]|nr:hypothetical protein [Gemmataceae bacterium]MDW8263803.1 hypothetical protein [Gemmataceae bacterium]
MRPLAIFALLLPVFSANAQPLPGTQPLRTEGDLAALMVAGIDKFLMRELAASVDRRRSFWKPDFSSPDAYAQSLRPNRERLRKILGVVDPRVPTEWQLVATIEQPALVAETDGYQVWAVRWPVLEGVEGEGLLLEPKGKPVACVVALPDADWTPEMAIGLAAGVPADRQLARRLAEHGCRVLVPVLIDRRDSWSGNPRFRLTNQPHREFIYRMAYEMGRHIIGYEVQKVLAAVDLFHRDRGGVPVKLLGQGEGALIAFYAGALDDRIDTTLVSGYFGPRETIWQEPIYRNVFGLLTEFGDAELAAYCWPHAAPPPWGGRRLLIDAADYPQVAGPPPVREQRSGAAPGGLRHPGRDAIAREIDRARHLAGQGGPVLINSDDDADPPQRTARLLAAFLAGGDRPPNRPVLPADRRRAFDPAPRQKRQFDQLVAFTQKLMRESEARRQEFVWSRLRGLGAKPHLEEYQQATEPLRRYFWEEVIGKLPPPTMPANPRSRLLYDEPKWRAYEVVLDVYSDVFAYGILCVPKDLKPGEKRPAVVCQHGLEGRPQDVVNPREKTRAYHSFGSQLADRGYVVFAPQNPYIGRDHFRVLQRKANPLKLSLFSFIVRQHERLLEWLATLPFVDGERIAFYGLSYGGKTAMRVPALLPGYCLSICSGDFNEWIVKNVSVDFRGSYMFTGEYEMPEFDLGNTFNYAEMAALIAPRPFMVERGHDDPVGVDEMVAYEYARVRRLYTKLGIADRTEIEFFDGGHVIHGQGTFAFLKRHLRWP